jgi:polysaccharide pyruvyl transferase WcaK-like protein
MKALLINRGNTDNLGDKAINFTMKSLLEKAGVEVDFMDFIGEKAKSVNYLNEAYLRLDKGSISNTKSIFKSFIRRIVWLTKRSGMFSVCFGKNKVDIVFIGGGQLINSNVYFPIAMFLWIILFKTFSKAKVVLFGIGSESQFNLIDRWLYKSALKKADEIYVRDYDSHKTLSEVFGAKAKYAPDVVYAIKQFIEVSGPNKSKRALIGPTSLKRLHKHNNKFNVKSDVDFWEDIILKYIRQSYITELFYTTIEDLVECIKVQRNFKLKYNQDISIATIDSLDELISVISSAQVIVSQRMHALILGQVYGCSLEPILISDKLISFKKQYLDTQKDIDELSMAVEKQLKDALS